jgi:hypothetical protein
MNLMNLNKYRTASFLKAETAIITCIAAASSLKTSCDTSGNVCQELQN